MHFCLEVVVCLREFYLNSIPDDFLQQSTPPLSHLHRMPFIEKKDIPFDPVNIGFFSAQAIMPDAQGRAHPLQ
jgi:hypothetical protein